MRFPWSRRGETRSATVPLSDPSLAAFLGARGVSGPLASPDTAISAIATAARCVNLISEGLAALPLQIFARQANGDRVPTEAHPLHRILNDAANDQMSGFELRDLLARDVLTSGNGFARIVRNARGAVTALHYMPATGVGVERLPNGRLRYRFADQAHGTMVLLAEETAHVRYKSRDGQLGISPLGWSPEAISLVVEQANLATSQARRGLVPDLAFSMDGAFDEKTGETAFQRLKDQLAARVGRMRDNVAPLLLEGGLKAQQLAPAGREAQFVEARQLGLEDVARLYGVPLSVIGLGRNASYGSLSEESRALVQNCFRPWSRRFDAQLGLALLSTSQRERFSLAHDLSDLLAGDPETRVKTYAAGIASGIYSPNEARRWDGLPAREGGDVFLAPANTVQQG
ncbi:phage portal protein [Azorhizobium doebereinerae]|uniref:phage portal protein n=1 Tax=Azorhizobium doebereinerae TaxID=281091 RepID=UPI000420A53A|nr:phage portal protein [Azorhizobium doebereinerae]